MRKRGRKSAAELTVVAENGQTTDAGAVLAAWKRPEPPRELGKAEARVWSEVVAARPPEWFTDESVPLLKAYCRATVSDDKVAAELAKYRRPPDEGPRLQRYVQLQRLQDVLQRRLMSLATKMRLSQQALRSDRGGTGAPGAKVPAVPRPWEG